MSNLTKKDFMSSQEVKWCPGCGDYSILASLQKTLPTLGVPKENFVMMSGIGCAARTPYYVNTYGFHTIHGRAPTIATGLKLMRPELSVWVITGDGDALSIGGNHFIHCLRRNIDINILLFNNEIYGLTKGQYSPTSEQGKITKSTPNGSIDREINPLALALGSKATFVARSFDFDSKHLPALMKATHEHKGASLLEIYQNCNIFNDEIFADITDKDKRAERILYLEHGKPMLFGEDNNKGLILDGLNLKVVNLGNDVSEDQILIHDETNYNLALLLANLTKDFPVPMGVIYRVSVPTYEDLSAQQCKGKQQSFTDIVCDEHCWEVE